MLLTMSKAASYLKVTLEGIFSSVTANLLEVEKELRDALGVLTQLSQTIKPLSISQLHLAAAQQLEESIINKVNSLVQEQARLIVEHRLQEPAPTLTITTTHENSSGVTAEPNMGKSSTDRHQP